MPIFRQGNMWDCWDEVDYFLITTNAYIKNNGALVMGRGIAKQVRDKFPGVDLEMGQRIQENVDCEGYYGVILGKKLGMFQVKYHFADNADATLILKSATDLGRMARMQPEKTFALNFPGIGNGKLNRTQVEPLLVDLPDNAHIWTFR